MTLICWLRRDLRLKDNPALAFAARAAQGRVIPVFVFDPAILGEIREALVTVGYAKA